MNIQPLAAVVPDAMRLTDKFFVRVGSRTQDTVKFKSGVEIYQDIHFEQQEKVTVMGEVVYGGIRGDIKPGDIVCFRYDVLLSELQEDGRRTWENLRTIDGEILWEMTAYQLVGVQRNGVWESVGRHVVGVPVKRRMPSLFSVHPTYDDPMTLKVTWKNDCGFEIGERLIVQPEMLQHYNFESKYGEDVVVISNEYILAKILPGAKEFVE